MKSYKNYLLGCIFAVGLFSSAYGADVTIVNKPTRWQTYRNGLVVADSANFDDSGNSTVPIFDNRMTGFQTLRVAIKFSVLGSSVVVHVLRGDFDGVAFTPRDVYSTTATVTSSGKLNGLYPAPSFPVDMAGFSGAKVLIESPNLSTAVDIDLGAY